MNNFNENNNEIYKYVSRKTFFFSLFAVCAFSLLCMLTAISANSSANDTYIPAAASPSSFLVRNIDGYVAICDANDAVPLEFLDVRVNTLSDTEQAVLDTGLYISSFTELIELIGAYTS